MKDVTKKKNEEGEIAYTCIQASDDGWEKDIHRIEEQYNKRINHVNNSDKSKEDKEKEIKQLKMNMLMDPRRPNIFYSTEETAKRKWRIANRLNTIKDNEFLTASYVLTWNTDKPDVWVGYYHGDITDLAVDAIVNAANRTILGGGGVDGAIHKVAGEELREECYKIREEKYPEGVPTGEAVITKGYNLPAKHVIHTPGPIWEDGTQGEPELLYNCYYNSLKLAIDNKVNVIAFPEISTGAYGYPKDEAEKVAFKAISDFVKDYPASLEEIILVKY